MQLLTFKNRVIGWLMVFVGIGFIPLAFSGDIIHPFLLVPEAGVEKYNYAGCVVSKLKPVILLYVLWFGFRFFAKINIDTTLNEWVLKSTKDISKVIVAVLLYQLKEVLDYVLFENVVPSCFDQFWFLIVWELGSLILLLTWAVVAAKFDY